MRRRPAATLAAAALVWLVLAAVAAAAAIPARPTGPSARPIVDEAGVLSREQVARLDATLGELYRKTGVTAGVLTVRSIAPDTIEGYAVRAFERWRLGREGKDDGLLLVLAVDERRVRLETGYGLEGTLPDGRAGALLDQYAVPYFREGRLGDGIVAVMSAAAAVLANEVPPDPPASRAPAFSRGPSAVWLILLLVLAIFLARSFGGSGRGPGGFGPMRRRRYGYGGPVIVPGGFGGFGGGSRGGGWGGFGGRSGGGGASRGW